MYWINALVCICFLYGGLVSISTCEATGNKKRQVKKTYIVSDDRTRWSKVNRLSPNLQIRKFGENGSQAISYNGGKTWSRVPAASLLTPPTLSWEISIPPDSFIACWVSNIREQPEAKTLSIVTSTNYFNRFFSLDAESGAERWRVNEPSKDSVFLFSGSYDSEGSTVFDGFVLNDRFFAVAGYACKLEVDRQSGKLIGLSYSLDAQYSSTPGPRLREDNKYYMAGNSFSGTRLSTLEADGRVTQSKTVGLNDLEDAWPNTILKLSDDGLLVTGIGYGKNSDLTPWLVKATKTGDSIWSYYGGGEAGDSVMLNTSHSLELNDGSILAISSARTRKKETPSYIHLLKFSASGELQLVKVLPSGFWTQANDFLELPHGLVGVAGITGAIPGSETANSEDFYLLLLDTALNVKAEYRWGVQGRFDQLTTLSSAANGDILVGGVTDGGENQAGAKNYFARFPMSQLSAPRTETTVKQFSINPNPATSTLEISLETEADDIRIEILDIKGAVVKHVTSNSRSNGLITMSVDVSDVARGYYFVRAITTAGVRVQPLIKR